VPGGAVRSGLETRPVAAGKIPPVTGSYIPRQETGLSLPSLPVGRATVLVPAEGTGPGLAWLGGTGKTTLACALAHAQRADQAAELVLWVTATGRDAVISGYAQALAELDGAEHQGEPEQAAERLLDRLAAAERPWLVVIDDLTDSSAVDGLCPAGPAGRVLLTARQPDAAAAIHRAEVIPVGAFSPREAMAYLSASLRTDPGQRTGALDLATELGFEPAPLSLAAAAMASTGLDCQRYLAYFSERRQALSRSFSSPSAASLAAAWSLSCELADQLGPSGMARRALALISMLAPHGVPGAVLASDAARAYLSGGREFLAEGAQVRAALNGLARAGLVTVDDASPARTVLVHQAVQVLARQHMTTAECEQAALAAADALVQAWPDGDAGSPATQALRDCAWQLRELAGTLLWQPQCHPVLVRYGQSLDTAGLTGPAVAYWQAMLGNARQMLGADHPQTVAAHGRLGAACEASGRIDEAISVYEAVLGDAERALGAGHPDTQNASERLLHGYLGAERRDEAIRLAERMLAGREQTLGPDHPDALAAHAELASTLLAAGRPAAACGTFERLLARRERVLGPGHPDTIAAQTSLADAYTRAGRFKDAIALGKRALADSERAQGAGHPDTTAARASLASAYRAGGKHKESLRLYERVLADQEGALGPGHPETIRIRSDVALSYLWLRKFKLAIVAYERTLADAQRALGSSHPITEQARQDLAEAAAVATAALGIDLRSAGPG
jgi:tetratricopeptide (TPR) repeat protein